MTVDENNDTNQPPPATMSSETTTVKKKSLVETSERTFSTISSADSSRNYNMSIPKQNDEADAHVEGGVSNVQEDAAHEEAEEEQPPTTTTMELSEEEQARRKCAFYQKLIIALVLVGIIVFVIIDSLTNGYVRDGVNTFLEWIQANPGPGVVVFAIVYFVATVLFIPGSILTLGSGFVFSASFGLGIGVLLGSLAVFVGASAGAIVSFLLGRYLLRDSVSTLSMKYSIFQALDNALETKGLRIMVLLRLSPIIPFNAINYIAGVSALKFMSYFWSLFAIIPGTVLYVFLGASASSLADSAMSDDSNTTVTVVVVVVGVVFGFLAVALTSYYARQELNKVVAQRQAETNQNEEQQEEEPGEEEDIEMGNTSDRDHDHDRFMLESNNADNNETTTEAC
mmetsp:Transcript_43471/g.105381  ORF Transcript_43471/g.105381 Transcript_43471/m.105381 type:complete len:397 (+) Transcript_43471:275-1465(+)